MPRKVKTEETVVTEENILHENDMEMDGESPDSLSADSDTDFSAAEESPRTAVSAESVSADEVSVEADSGITEPLPLQEETVSVDELDSHDTLPASDGTDPVAETGNPSEASSSDRTASKPARKRAKASAIKTAESDAPTPIKKAAPSSILTLSADAEVETQESREDTIWHELQNAYRTRKILTGTLGGIEKMEGGGTIAVVYYKEIRIVIPLAEMMINLVEDTAQ